jgi:hypothetical protein
MPRKQPSQQQEPVKRGAPAHPPGGPKTELKRRRVARLKRKFDRNRRRRLEGKGYFKQKLIDEKAAGRRRQAAREPWERRKFSVPAHGDHAMNAEAARKQAETERKRDEKAAAELAKSARATK